jgi:dihydroxyacetone kinase-like protein
MKRAELQALGQSVNRRTRSMGVALTSCTVPAAGKPNFEIGDREVEMGVGIHGEPGRRRIPLASAHAMVEEMVDAILHDLSPKHGEEAILFVNGFGGTPLIELYLLYHEAARKIEAAGVKPERSLVGSYVTSLDMAGASITLSLLDAATTKLWDAPVYTPALRWGV